MTMSTDTVHMESLPSGTNVKKRNYFDDISIFIPYCHQDYQLLDESFTYQLSAFKGDKEVFFILF